MLYTEENLQDDGVDGVGAVAVALSFMSIWMVPLAVAVFRLTSPVANLSVVLFICHVSGIQPPPAQFAAAGLVAFAVSISSVGLPGQLSFFVSVAPICLAIGAPIELLPLLLAVEVIPDIFRTVGNVTADLMVTTILNRGDKGVRVIAPETA